MLIASCENSEPSSQNSPIAPVKHESKGNAHDAKLMEGEISLDVLKFSTNHVMIEQILVEPSLDLPLSQEFCLIFLVINMIYMMIFMLYPYATMNE